MAVKWHSAEWTSGSLTSDVYITLATWCSVSLQIANITAIQTTVNFIGFHEIRENSRSGRN